MSTLALNANCDARDRREGSKLLFAYFYSEHKQNYANQADNLERAEAPDARQPVITQGETIKGLESLHID